MEKTEILILRVSVRNKTGQKSLFIPKKSIIKEGDYVLVKKLNIEQLAENVE